MNEPPGARARATWWKTIFLLAEGCLCHVGCRGAHRSERGQFMWQVKTAPLWWPTSLTTNESHKTEDIAQSQKQQNSSMPLYAPWLGRNSHQPISIPYNIPPIDYRSFCWIYPKRDPSPTAQVALTGLTVAEYFRDEEGQVPVDGGRCRESLVGWAAFPAHQKVGKMGLDEFFVGFVELDRCWIRSELWIGVESVPLGNSWSCSHKISRTAIGARQEIPAFQDVLLFVDNIFRFTQAGSEVSRGQLGDGVKKWRERLHVADNWHCLLISLLGLLSALVTSPPGSNLSTNGHSLHANDFHSCNKRLRLKTIHDKKHQQKP